MAPRNPLLQLPPSESSTELSPAWVPAPLIRSTYGILQSCILTFVLAAWTVFHPPIPDAEERNLKWSGLSRVFFKIFHAVVVLLLPEVCVFKALREYQQAWGICRRLREIEQSCSLVTIRNTGLEQNPCRSQFANSQSQPETLGGSGEYEGIELPQLNQTRNETRPGATEEAGTLSLWKRMAAFLLPKDLEHGFYVTMGGYEFVTSIPADNAPGTPTNSSSFRLKPVQVMLLASLGLFKPTPMEDIKDRSKADTLTKTLACMQALWIVISTTARKVAGLSVTLLEFNAVMHVICALIAYMAWLRKPQDVTVPTKLERGHGGLNSNIEALLCVQDDELVRLIPQPAKDSAQLICRVDVGEAGDINVRWELKEGNSGLGVEIEGERAAERIAVVKEFWITGASALWQSVAETTISTSLEAEDLTPEVMVPLGDTTDHEELAQASSSASPVEGHSPAARITLRLRKDQPVHHEGLEFLAKYYLGQIDQAGEPGLEWSELFSPTHKNFNNRSLGLSDIEWLYLPKPGNIRKTWASKRMAIYSGLAWVVFTTTYGGLHLLAWNSYFPTLLERYMWRISGCIIGGGLPAYCSSAILVAYFGNNMQQVRDTGVRTGSIPYRASIHHTGILLGGLVSGLGGSLGRWCGNIGSRTSTPRWLLWPIFILKIIMSVTAFAITVVITAILFVVFVVLAGTQVVVMIVGYVAFWMAIPARLYILIEGFLCMRKLPAAAYERIAWTQFLPHF